jgi:phosphotransacetylase
MNSIPLDDRDPIELSPDEKNISTDLIADWLKTIIFYKAGKQFENYTLSEEINEVILKPNIIEETETLDFAILVGEPKDAISAFEKLKNTLYYEVMNPRITEIERMICHGLIRLNHEKLVQKGILEQ